MDDPETYGFPTTHAANARMDMEDRAAINQARRGAIRRQLDGDVPPRDERVMFMNMRSDNAFVEEDTLLQRFDRFDAEHDRLVRSVHDLLARLEPVLVPEAPTEDSEGMKSSDDMYSHLSTMAENVERRILALHILRGTVDRYNARIDL